ncbi:MAG: hypothetical protein IPJ62_06715 [Betaproteobacteria bacterium]|nr:hypothetical protein [Betaproteobacteria bacterium]
MQAIAKERLRLVATLIQRAGPYLLLELLLPGGTLFALLLFLYRRSRRDDFMPAGDDPRARGPPGRHGARGAVAAVAARRGRMATGACSP